MVWERGERIALTVLGAVLLAGLAVIWRLDQRAPLRIEGEAAPGMAAQWDAAVSAARRVDVNTADASELERLPGVGPALAQAIVARRAAHGTFRTPEDLMGVPGIGPKTLAGLQDYVTTDAP